MTNFSERLTIGFKRFLPNPFTIAILLTLITFLLALIITKPAETQIIAYSWYLLENWEKGLWDSSQGGIYFAFQMMLMLVLGHCLALTRPIEILMNRLLRYCKNSASSALTIALSAMLLGLVNWGLGLIFGAILARKIGEKFSQTKTPINYGLIVACGYLGMLVWHGGLSGSAPTKVMEPNYLASMMQGVNMEFSPSTLEEIPFELTVGSPMNLITNLILIVAVLLIVIGLTRFKSNESVLSLKTGNQEEHKSNEANKGAERLDKSAFFGFSIGITLLLFGVIKAFNYTGTSSLGFIQPNFINFMLFGLGLMLHRSVFNFLNAIQNAIGDIAGILIQFPLYFGILGLMKSSGLIVVFSEFLIQFATVDSLPIYTFLSAGLVNFFVPSGGGQWAIQGPIIMQSATALGADIPKTIMAMAYGDQLTNMLQPFWALPLLGITKIEAYKILPYTAMFFVVGLIVFLFTLFVF